MRKLGSDIQFLLAKLSPEDARQARIDMRAHQVRHRYKAALESVYKNKAALFLLHTNNVYIVKKDDARKLIVYVDESIFSAELNAQRELIKLKMLELFGEELDEFVIKVSRGEYRKHHPYVTEGLSDADVQPKSAALDKTEMEYVSDTVATVQDEHLRKSVEKAMTADMKWKKAENAKLIGKD